MIEQERKFVMSELKEKQLQYWNELLTYARRNGKEVIGALGPYESTANELLISIGGGRIQLRAWMDKDNGFIGVTLYLTGTRKHGAYQASLVRRQEIDSALGQEVTDWIPPGEASWRSDAGYVAPTKKYVDPMDESDWPNQHRWLADTLKRYDRVFRPIVQQL